MRVRHCSHRGGSGDGRARACSGNLGNALLRLGAREGGTARLEEAVAAPRAALEEKTRERVPLDWATTQNNLGNALWTLGERSHDPNLLGEALDAVPNAYGLVVKEAGYLQYEAYFPERLERIQASLNAIER